MGESIRVGVCVPSAGMCPIFFAQSVVEMFINANQVLRSRKDASDFAMRMFIRQSSNIPNNRQKLVEQALEWGASHILFIDDDMIFDPRLLEVLLSRRLPMVACNYPKRQLKFEFTATKADRSGYMETTKNSAGFEEAWYCGFGFCLIERQVFEKKPKPWFMPYYDTESGDVSSEDNPFCELVRQAGFKVLIDHAASRQIGHMGQHIYTWRENPEQEKEQEMKLHAMLDKAA